MRTRWVACGLAGACRCTHSSPRRTCDVHFIEAALEEAPDDAAFIASVLGVVARARNIADLAGTIGIARETMYKMLRGEGNLAMGNLSKLAKSLPFRLSLVLIDDNGKPAKAKAKPKPASRSGTQM